MVIAILNIIAFSIMFIGSLNWGLIGIFNFNLVEAIFGAGLNAGTIIVYVLVLISALWLLFILFWQRFKIIFCPRQSEMSGRHNYNINDNKK